MKTYYIAAIPGDGIGAEVISFGVEILQALAQRDGGFQLHITNYDWGSEYMMRHGEMMPADGLDRLRPMDAILFGSAGHPDIPDHVTLWGLRLKICQGLDQYANVRPARLLPGIEGPLKDVGPDRLDWVIVRENTEGEYAGIGGRVHRGLPGEVGMDVTIFTRSGVERIQRFAFELANSRPRKKLTLVTKSNAMRHGMVFWDEMFETIGCDYPEVKTDRMLVDAMTTRMIFEPETIDTVVATNLHADILSDLAAALTGSLGILADGLDRLRPMDAILFGSAGHPDIPDHVTLWGLRLKICQGLDQYANVRPARLLPGIEGPLKDVGPDRLDWVIVRENTEGEYAGIGGRVHRGLPGEVGMDVTIFTRSGVERIQRFAFELANSRPRKKLTLVTKSNAMRHGMVFWDEMFETIGHDYPDVKTDRMLVDAMTTRMILEPETIDTVVATNLHADILSDLAAALTGSLGIAPTANLMPERTAPSMFEPIHGSAFDLMGKGIANPIGTFWSGVMMMEHLGEQQAASRLMSAIERVTKDGTCLPRDLGGNATTREVTDAVIEAIRTANE